MGDKSIRGLRRRRAPTEQQQVGDQPPHAASSLPLESGTRVYGAAGWSPSRSQRAPRRSARQVELEYRKRLTDQRRAELEALRQDERDRPFLPAGGETGPMAGRSYRRLRLVPHRATSEVLAGAYPFLAEEGLGSEGMLIGQDAWSGAAFCYDPWELYRQGALTNPNICLAGQIGRGKSTLAKSLAARCVAFGRRVYVPGDPKGEWTVVTRALGGQVVELGVGTSARLNPLDDGPRPSGLDDAAWQSQVTARRLGLLAALAEATLGRALRATERTALDTALDAARCENSTPVLPMVVAAMLEPRRPFAGSTVEELRSDGREVAHALARLVRGDLAGLFDGPSTVQFDPGAANAVIGPVGRLRLGHLDRLGDDLCLDMDGGGARRPERGTTPCRLRRGVAPPGAAGSARTDAGPVEAVARLGIGEPHGSPPAVGPGSRGRRRLGGPWPRAGAARGHRDSHLVQRTVRGVAGRWQSAWPHLGRGRPAPPSRPRRRALEGKRASVRRPPHLHARTSLTLFDTDARMLSK